MHHRSMKVSLHCNRNVQSSVPTHLRFETLHIQNSNHWMDGKELDMVMLKKQTAKEIDFHYKKQNINITFLPIHNFLPSKKQQLWAFFNFKGIRQVLFDVDIKLNRLHCTQIAFFMLMMKTRNYMIAIKFNHND